MEDERILQNYRNMIDEIDDEIKILFEKRMSTALDIAKYKEQHSLPIQNTMREREILTRVTQGQEDELAGYTKVLYSTLFDLSRSYQGRDAHKKSPFAAEIKAAAENTPKLFPKSAPVACQGIEGSNSQMACERLFARPNIMYMNSFEAVFSSVEKGLCRYGVLPMENSLYGSVIGIYDLMKKYRFYIVKSTRMMIEHTLLANYGASLEDIGEIFSHEQALGQCGEFLKCLKNVKITPCENTAIAAKMVADSKRKDIAAIASKNCASLYGLTTLSGDIQDDNNNYTRFICISKKMEIYPGSNKISFMFSLPHRPGSLAGVLSKFSAVGMNLTKLESLPIPGKDFEFMFFADLEANIYDEAALNLLAGMENTMEKFIFLGSYCQ